MKEPFQASVSDLARLTEQTNAINDIQITTYLNTLSPSGQSAFIRGNMEAARESILGTKASTYTSAMNQATGADNSITSAAYYLSRTKDLSTAVGEFDSANQRQLSVSQLNSGLNKRQKEINEWSNLNKLDTLYFMQVLFVSLSLCGFLAFLSTNGTISSYLFVFVSYIIGILAVIVLLLRWRYTNVARDARYWHKARFGSED